MRAKRIMSLILFLATIIALGYVRGESQTTHKKALHAKALKAGTPCNNGSCSIGVSWVAPASGTAPTGYNVYRTQTSGSCNSNPATAPNCTKAGSTSAPTVTFTDNTLQASTQYCYVATATANSLESVPSNESCATTAAPPPVAPNAPTGLSATPQ